MIARQHGDLDLEVWALSEQGRGLVSLGEVEDGMALLDEAVAAATAGGRNLIIVGDACCNMLSACDRAADFARALQWCQVVDTFARRYNSVPIVHYCRVVYCGVLIATGRWVEAERELQAALRAVEQKYPTEKGHSSSRLTLLCVRQGRLEEASQFQYGEGFCSRLVEWGGMIVSYETFPKGVDATPLFKGLPDDMCQSPHWGYLLRGQVRIKRKDGDVVLKTGDVYYLEPGHVPIFEEDTEILEFSPTEEYRQTISVVARNMAAAKTANWRS